MTNVHPVNPPTASFYNQPAERAEGVAMLLKDLQMRVWSFSFTTVSNKLPNFKASNGLVRCG